MSKHHPRARVGARLAALLGSATLVEDRMSLPALVPVPAIWGGWSSATPLIEASPVCHHAPSANHLSTDRHHRRAHGGLCQPAALRDPGVRNHGTEVIRRGPIPIRLVGATDLRLQQSGSEPRRGPRHPRVASRPGGRWAHSPVGTRRTCAARSCVADAGVAAHRPGRCRTRACTTSVSRDRDARSLPRVRRGCANQIGGLRHSAAGYVGLPADPDAPRAERSGLA